MAMQNDEAFHVWIILPLFPAGNVVDLSTRYVLEWVYKTSHKGVRSRLAAKPSFL